MISSIIGIAFDCPNANDLAETEEYAIECGAKKADVPYYDTSTVMIDPAGHPFCLSTIQQ